MPFIQFELDAKKKVPPAARLAGLSEAQLGWGLTCLWEWCWGQKTDVVTVDHLIGIFDGDGPKVGKALVAFGFAERLEDGDFRVRGAARYLRVTAARKKGADITNEKRRATEEAETAETPLSDPGATVERPLSDKGATPNVALSPNTEHRTPILKEEEEKAPAPTKEVEPPRIAHPDSPSLKFFCRAQDSRTDARLAREKPPNLSKLAAWHSYALGELNGDEERLFEAWLCFGDDPYWQVRKCPFAGFMSQWEKYAPQAKRRN